MSFKEHRERLYETLEENTLVIAYAGIPVHTNEDEYYDFVVNSQYFYLTGLEREKTAFLAYKTAEKTREILFIEEPDPKSERWTGKMPTIEEVACGSVGSWFGAQFSVPREDGERECDPPLVTCQLIWAPVFPPVAWRCSCMCGCVCKAGFPPLGQQPLRATPL